MWEPTRLLYGEGRRLWRHEGTTPHDATAARGPAGVLAVACLHTEIRSNTGSPRRCGSAPQPEAREGQAGPPGVADGFVVPRKPSNAGGGKGPEFKVGVRRDMRARRVAKSLSPPRTVQNSQAASRARSRVQRGEACFLVREPDALVGPVRFDERGEETGHGRDGGTPADERAG
jgi:hypothetical protein